MDKHNFWDGVSKSEVNALIKLHRSVRPESEEIVMQCAECFGAYKAPRGSGQTRCYICLELEQHTRKVSNANAS